MENKLNDLREALCGVVNALELGVDAGSIYEIEAIVIAKEMEQLAKRIKDRNREGALLNVQRWEGTKVLGYEATRKDGATRYKYDHIEAYQKRKEALKRLEKDLKDAYLQAQRGKMLVDENGEVLPQAEPVHGKEQIVLTYKG